jgi:hypothetical protein
MPTPKQPVLKTFQCTWCDIHATSYTRPQPGNYLRKIKDKRWTQETTYLDKG